MVKVNAQKCLMCGDVIYSRARHDFHYCSCGNVFVDGGPVFNSDKNADYSRVGAFSFNLVKSVIYELDIDRSIEWVKKVFYHDWNNQINKYGLWRDKNYTDDMRMAAKAKIKLLEKK